MGVTVPGVLSTRSDFFPHFLVVEAWNSPSARPLANGARAREQQCLLNPTGRPA